jgi:hypothetical protein
MSSPAPSAVSHLLTALGFECLGNSRAHDGAVMWMLSLGARDILITLPENATVSDAAESIYDAGARDKRDEIQGRWSDFQNALKYSRTDTLWTEARELQRLAREEREKAASMPKNEA